MIVLMQNPYMSRAIVYQNLHLVEDESIKPRSFPNSPERFNMQIRMHYHGL